LLAASWVRNINQFQTVYSFLIAPIFYLSGVFFPVAEKSALGVLVQFSPFFHGVKLIQFTVWGQFSPGETLWHVCALVGFTVVIGGLSFGRIARKLTS
jgi:lipooligosaccharide transport system permease protein